MKFHDWWYDSRTATINFITEVKAEKRGLRVAARQGWTDPGWRRSRAHRRL
jgi:hypothetical protein